MKLQALLVPILASSSTTAQNTSMPIPNGGTLIPADNTSYSGNIAPIPWHTRPEVYDHMGAAVRHGRARLNSIRMHYYTAGSGPPLLLVHGTPKTNYYWYKLVPLLSQHFTIVAPDLRGFGYTDKPGAETGYDSTCNARDLAGLMGLLGFEKFHVHGEDRNEEAFWTYFMESECFNPIALSREAVAEWTRAAKGPGGLRGILETYRAGLVNGRINRQLSNTKLTLPIMTIGSPEFFGAAVRPEMLKVAATVERSYVFEACGHSLALEADVRLADALKSFMLGRNSTN